jgi:hypothetical protein
MLYYLQILMVALGAGLLTWRLNHHFQRGPVLASAVVTLVAGLVLPKLLENGAVLAAMAACGSYVSMSATARLRGWWETSFALVFAAVIFSLTGNVFVGTGGKLGTIAAIGAMTVWSWRQIIEASLRGGMLARVYTRMF